MTRENTKQIKVGSLAVGGGAAVTVQSMCTTATSDIEATSAQINALAAAGCDIVRVAVPDMAAARAISGLKERTAVPLVADIHFDYKLALECAARGIDKIRINPGNIGAAENVRAVASACAARGIPIRIGVNGGSLEKRLLEKYGGPTPEALCDSAEGHVRLLEQCGFTDVCVSMKAADVPLTIAAYRLAAQRFPYPLHLGMTHTGPAYGGLVRSAMGIGTLLNDGIGDTIRVSLTADPLEEVRAGIEILKCANLRRGGVRIISCPTCGRCQYDLISAVQEVEARLAHLDRELTVAVMGCTVNGPGEAREADYGVAGGGQGVGALFKKGQVVGKASMDRLADALIELIESEGGI